MMLADTNRLEATPPTRHKPDEDGDLPRGVAYPGGPHQVILRQNFAAAQSAELESLNDGLVSGAS